ncbi:T9SS type B sorting domain-containing protein [Seonamhaeicola sp. ML3]|uniref:T9SS type B sorting domain-containing protein n=1 Tax=Seonamhaeicola sp. ML3 TaxID=2937786 RepID=UPI00200FA04D|nr:T9SS type B sorting domain-containing protein [Seonamhaeicola sp. ML3]
MFNRAHFLVLLLLLSYYAFSQNTFVPDDNFEQALIDLGYDTPPLDDFVPTVNISNVTNLDVSNKNITDLTGIEDFVILSILNCSENQIINLDISKNLGLTQLFCDKNKLTSLNVINNPLLQILWCDDNQISSLDMSENPDLISLICSENLLTQLNISINTELRILHCNQNKLTSIDITKCVFLTQLVCDDNFLSSIDTSKNIELQLFLTADNLITSFNLSNNIKLERFRCVRNQLSELDVSKNINLEFLYCGINSINELDITNNVKLKTVHAVGNNISILDTSNNPELELLHVSVNNLTSLDLSNNPNLSFLSCVDNSLCFINIQNGNNSIISTFKTTSNPFLTCIFVDNVIYSDNNWTDIDTVSNFVNSQEECNSQGNGLPKVDVLDDFIGTSYVLPPLENGSYYTQTNAGGVQLMSGEVITTSQTIYINNNTPCYSNESSFNIIISGSNYLIPKYFTPNNDNTNDTWKVVDNSNTFTSINIYNRYGKLLKSLSPNNFEWDGTFNGKLMETNDYWYVINRDLEKPITGHFTLKR